MLTSEEIMSYDKVYDRWYRQKNRARILAGKRRYRLEHKQEIAEYRLAHRADAKKYRLAHKAERAVYSKTYQKKHKIKLSVYNHNYTKNHKPERVGYSRRYALNHPAKTTECWRRCHRKRAYGLSHVEYLEMLSSQNNRCKLCRIKFGEKRENIPHVDHNHVTGKVRGLLCRSCNLGLGNFKDNPIIMNRAIEYVRESH